MSKRRTLLPNLELRKFTGSHRVAKALPEIAEALGRSYNYIWNNLKRETNGYKHVNCVKTPAPTVSHKSRHLEWVKTTINKITGDELDIKKITFTDEKRIWLNGPGCTRY